MMQYSCRSKRFCCRFDRGRNIGRLTAWGICLPLIFLAGCSEIRSPKPEVFIGKPAPSSREEFRWSNGKTPKSFDPARASASPETDVVRALYEGLTDLDGKRLEPVPALAVSWSASDDHRVWTFQLRSNAKWSNGEPVTAADFVRSWKRLANLGEKVVQRDLLKNIVGLDTENVLPVFSNKEDDIFSNEPSIGTDSDELQRNPGNSNSTGNIPVKTPPAKMPRKQKATKRDASIHRKITISDTNFGVEAVSTNILKVTLKEPDENFPALVANPIYRPIYGEGGEFDSSGLNANLVTNGAFRLVSVGKDGILLARSDSYWNRNEVGIEKVRFVPAATAENALAAYRAGEIDALTNANFAPLALKLLTPFAEFRRTKHAALNFYEFNLSKKPFDDHRVREALTIAIDRARITEDEMDGATEPAFKFLPFDEDTAIVEDAEKARKLLADAGFANGENFPVIRLVVNRNDLQKRIARAVAKMWKKSLNVDTEIIIKEPADFETAIQNGEYDMIRRGIVLPTSDETANMLAMFEPRTVPKAEIEETDQKKSVIENQAIAEKSPEASNSGGLTEGSKTLNENAANENLQKIENPSGVILNEDQAMAILPAIPLYFPASHSLIKPYVRGFELNALDAPSLKNIRIDSNWRPSDPKVNPAEPAPEVKKQQ